MQFKSICIYAQIHEFFLEGGGGGGVQNCPDVFFGFFFFYSSTYFIVYRGGPMALLQRKLYFSKDPEGVQHFLARGGGVQLFPGVGGRGSKYWFL